jgi:hypothetical protein
MQMQAFLFEHIPKKFSEIGFTDSCLLFFFVVFGWKQTGTPAKAIVSDSCICVSM